MGIDRRDFLKLASVAGFSSVVAPHAWGGKDLSYGRRNTNAPYTGVFSILVNAGGGWSPTEFADIKPARNATDPNPVTNIQEAWLAQAGPFRYPTRFSDEVEMLADPNTAAIPAFFEAWSNELLVINGIDMQTNGHDSGQRHMWSGRLVEGAASLGAYLAATWSAALPMAFLAFGGFSETAGIAPRTRAGNLDVLARLAYPTRRDPDDENSTYLSSRALELIEEAQWHRDQAIISGQGLPKIRNSANTLFTSRSGSNELRLLQEKLPEVLPDDDLQRQMVVALAAYEAGIAVSANVSIGGFDTHGNHDQSSIPNVGRLLAAIDFGRREAERRGIADRVLFAAGSDFGRTPGYNDGNGKDHWSITSMLFMGPGVQGNTLVGETNENHEAYGINPDLSINRVEEAETYINPGHIHSSLRDAYARGEENELAFMFPLDIEQKLPLPFTPVA